MTFSSLSYNFDNFYSKLTQTLGQFKTKKSTVQLSLENIEYLRKVGYGSIDANLTKLRSASKQEPKK